ncbi:MAG TPA: radical SAM family heme chaperone HemW [Flavilitoribacter sp.]|nr:radical SAM family heme chaperone HemW [Flavilitoribacter sp.]
MAGIYFHIPFCKQACHYCNFHFSTSLRNKPDLLEAMMKELALRSEELGSIAFSTVYLGGGTPSLLTPGELEMLFSGVFRHFKIEEDAEITLEANPDDLTPEYLMALAQSPVNRLSIGVQSFFEEDLRWMNRAHSGREARACIETAQKAGFDNITVDLIYGSPTTTGERWAANIDTLLEYGIPHLSCYALTVEPKTALAHFVEKGKTIPPDEHQGVAQYEYLMTRMQQEGYDHYEISNFAKPGRYARHNSSYWQGEPYIGIGPAAHSFDGFTTRLWNVSNNPRYIKAMTDIHTPEDRLKQEGRLFEKETLSPADRFNEYVMTGLRTIWGCELPALTAIGPEFQTHFLSQIQSYIDQGLVVRQNEVFRLSNAGRLLADRIASDLFVV